MAPERLRAVTRLKGGLRGRLEQRPLLYGALIAAAIFVAATVIGTVLGQSIAAAAGSQDLRKPAGLLGLDLVGAGCLAWMLSRLGWWREVGFGGPSTWRSLPLLAVPGAVALVSLAGGIVNLDGDPARLALRLPALLLTGFWEEGLTRGLLLSLLLVVAVRTGRDPVWCVVTSAAIFGGLHLVNVIGGPPPFSVLVQVVFATLLGIAFGALALRTNALWLLVGLHALFNTGSALQGESDGTNGFEAILVLSTLPLAAYGLFLLRRTKPGKQPATAEPATGASAPAST